MIYGFSLLTLVLALVLGVPALRNLLRMRRINRHGKSATGHITRVKTNLGWLWSSNFGNATQPRILFETDQGKEMILELVTSSMFTLRQYEAGQLVEVIYDAENPWEAYALPEWSSNQRDLWFASASLLLSAVLLVYGRYLQVQAERMLGL
jgi:hypothetical protein